MCVQARVSAFTHAALTFGTEPKSCWSSKDPKEVRPLLMSLTTIYPKLPATIAYLGLWLMERQSLLIKLLKFNNVLVEIGMFNL